jgi:hypothetical protein
MNEFTVKKLAEVQAFNQLGITIAERAGEPLAGSAPDAVRILRQVAEHDFTANISEQHLQLFTDKTGMTERKLTSMMELYVGDEWDNPVEALEWSSFYAGAGAAHSALTATAAEPVDTAVSASAAELAGLYQELLQQVMAALRKAAADRR